MTSRSPSRHRLVFLAVLLAVPMLWGARPCAQWVCQFGAAPVVVNLAGTIDVGDPLQTGHVFRDGRPSTCTGKTNVLKGATPVHYEFFNLTNPNAVPTCAIVDANFSGCGNQTQVNAYSAFVPATPDTGLLGDLGYSSSVGGALSFPLAPGQIYTLVVHELTPNAGCPSFSLTVTYRVNCRTPGFDVSGDRSMDPAVFRPSDGTWYAKSSGGGSFIYPFGASTDIPMPGDYNSDGHSDPGVWRPGALGFWYTAFPFQAVQWGTTGDIPVPTDFDRDGRVDMTVFRPSSGTWYTRRSFDQVFQARQWGMSGDMPFAGDFDGDFFTDYGVARPNGGQLDWYIQMTYVNFTFQVSRRFGFDTDKVVPADYDGDGRTDIAVWRPSNGTWYYLASSAGISSGWVGPLQAFQFGSPGDSPQPSDVDGDGKADFVVFRQSVTPGQTRWYAWLSATQTLRVEQWGQQGDLPVTAQNRIQ